MTVTADYYEAKVSEALVTMLSACALFQSLSVVATAAAAKAFIIEDDGGDGEDENRPPVAVNGEALITTETWASVRLNETRRVERAWLTWGYEGDAAILLVLKRDPGDTPAEGFRRARNAGGAIASQLQAQVGGAGLLAYAEFNLGDISLAEESGSLAGSFIAPISVAWRDLP